MSSLNYSSRTLFILYVHLFLPFVYRFSFVETVTQLDDENVFQNGDVVGSRFGISIGFEIGALKIIHSVRDWGNIGDHHAHALLAECFLGKEQPEVIVPTVESLCGQVFPVLFLIFGSSNKSCFFANVEQLAAHGEIVCAVYVVFVFNAGVEEIEVVLPYDFFAEWNGEIDQCPVVCVFADIVVRELHQRVVDHSAEIGDVVVGKVVIGLNFNQSLKNIAF